MAAGRRWIGPRVQALPRAQVAIVARFRRRSAVLAGAVAVGLVAVAFARASDAAGALFDTWRLQHRWWPLATTPVGFAALVWLTRRFAPLARGSGIPQVIAARADPVAATGSLISIRTVLAKAALTIAAVLCGASVGREGPTVQLAAAVMGVSHRVARAPLRGSVVIAGGAAGVAAAFNTPIAGLLFAIEELAAVYEQRVTLLVITAIVVAGMVAQSLSGDYVYFGAVGAHMPLSQSLVAAPVAGLAGGAAGGLFARLMLAAGGSASPLLARVRERPVLFAGLCGAVVAALGAVTGLTWGAGYSAARAMIVGVDAPWWFGPAKFTATLATAVAGLPGGIFAPSLSVGAGLGNLLRPLFPGDPAGAVVMLGMVAYFAGVVRAPLTAVVILSETTASRELILPMFAAAFIADWTSTQVSPDKLYHALSLTFGAPSAHELT